MVLVHTNPNNVNDRVALDFSDEEIQRIKEICEELREIFMAESVGISKSEISNGLPVSYQIDITCCPARRVFKKYY